MLLGVRLIDPIGSLTAGAPASVGSTITLRQAAEELASEWIGLAVVADHRGVLGVVSERDIVQALAEGADPDVARVIDVMTDDVASVPADATVAEAADVMTANEIRHLAVTEDGEIAGVVSIRDIVGVMLEELGVGDA